MLSELDYVWSFMYVPRENLFRASNAAMRVHKPKHFHIGRLCLCLPSALIWLGLFMSALILASCGPTSSVDPTSTVNDITNEGTPKPQAHASWQMQLETAQKEAAKIDPTAVLQQVETYFTVAQLQGDKAWRTGFIFVRPNGVRISVWFKDTSPPSEIDVDPALDTYNVKLSQAELQRYASLISKVKIGPRELVQKILEKNINYDSALVIDMTLNIEHQQDLGVANPWVVSYVDLSKKTSTVIFAAPDTGEIVARDNYGPSP
jgi:hypothetical protein